MADKSIEIPLGYYIETNHKNPREVVITVYESLDKLNLYESSFSRPSRDPLLQHIIRLGGFRIYGLDKITLEDYIDKINEGIIKIIKEKAIPF